MAEPAPHFAAEHALGLLEGEELATARRLMLSDVEFARAVDEWRQRLAPMVAEIASVPVPDHVWPAIERQVAGQVGAGGSVAPIARSNPWKVATWATGAIAASLAALLIFVRPTPAPIPDAPATMMVAQLTGNDMAKPVVMAFNSRDNRLKIHPSPHPMPGHSAELWIIPEGGKPSSLGVISLDRGGEMPVAPAHGEMFGNTATLAISAEPMGGSPTGAPTGPVIASGTLTTI